MQNNSLPNPVHTCERCQADFGESEGVIEYHGPHKKLSCPFCLRFITFLKQTEPTPMDVLTFGKYRGRTVMSATHEDRSYAEWFVRTQKGRYREAFLLALKSL